MGRKNAQAAAKKAASGAAVASGSIGPLPEAVRQGMFVTLAFFTLYYLFLLAQAVMKRKLRAHYTAHEKKFDRYFSKDKKMLGWDRTVGNMLEQSVPFLLLFWLSIFSSDRGGLPHLYIVTAGWMYVGLRALYPILWFSGGGGAGGTTSIIWRVTFPMYLIILFLAGNVAYTAAISKA